VNKTAVKNFAVRARRKLLEEVTHKAYEIGITKDKVHDIETFDGGFKVKGRENGRIFKKHEIEQRVKLVQSVEEKGFAQVTEEVAYTWFNRFIALRFMEINHYLPAGVRVLSSAEAGKTEPDIIREALNIDLEVDPDIVFRLQDSNDTEDLYKYLLIRQCNQLGKIMPAVFEKIADYTELLLPDKLLAEGSVIRDLVESIEEYDWKIELSEEEQELEAEKGEHGIEIIGWLYQYYISEKKDEVFAGLKKNKKITKENIPAATQLFTPKWIVKYMVENSLGRLWLESHPNEELKAQWKYYLEEAEQEPEVRKQLDALKNPGLTPEEIKVLDPAMGSGHILVYAFDVLYEIYLSAGYSEREIPTLILEKNLYGLEIDDRAGQLACFALLMKARNKNRRIFRKRPKLNLCSIQESNGIPEEAIDYLVTPKETDKAVAREEVEYLIKVFHDAKEYGSILEVKEIDFDALESRIAELRNSLPFNTCELEYKEVILEKLPPLVQQARIMSQKYDVVCTNPPYMGNSGMGTKLSNFTKKNYPDAKSDLFTVFIQKGFGFAKSNGFNSMITMQSWMFLKSFEKMRENIIISKNIVNLIQIGYNSFPELNSKVAQATAFVFKNMYIRNYISSFFDLNNKYPQAFNKEKAFLKEKADKTIYFRNSHDFSKIPGMPIAYWLSDKFIKIFDKSISLGKICKVSEGIKTGNNEKYIKIWYEINSQKFSFGKKPNSFKWYPQHKGGSYRKWYGNNELVINWEYGGQEIKNCKNSGLQGREMYFNEIICWTKITTMLISFRYFRENHLFDSAGPAVSSKKNLHYILGFLNSKIAGHVLAMINPTISFQVGDIKKLPIIFRQSFKLPIENIVNQNIAIAKTDWDSFETSWDFKKHPLLAHKGNAGTIKEAFENWSDFAEKQFRRLKQNEEELNRIFIEIYGLQDELTPEVEDKDITINKADRERDIKSFISYAVGCIFGRYSLDEEGVIYAGGDFSAKFKLQNGCWEINTKHGWKKSSTAVAKNSVIPIADGDYFEDDLAERLVQFVKAAFGAETLEANLSYIAETLGKKNHETSKQAIRRYLLKDFYKDHVKTYKKRPIYWLFESGKQNGFKALIYLHRYDPFTVARVRTDYLHELQKKYEAEVNHLDIIIDADISDREKAAARKRKEVILKRINECRTYDQAIAHVANQKIDLDLDDGVKVNYAKFQGIEIPQGEGKKPLIADLLAKI